MQRVDRESATQRCVHCGGLRNDPLRTPVHGKIKLDTHNSKRCYVRISVALKLILNENENCNTIIVIESKIIIKFRAGTQ